MEICEKPTIDNLLSKTAGRFQVFSTLVHAIGFCMGGFLSFALPLVELFPQFECYDPATGGYSACSRQEACAGQWRVDWEAERSIRNWVSEMGLECVDKWKIGLFGSMYYFGYLIGSICFVNMSDIYGRKICTRTSYILHTVSFFCIIFISDLYVRYGCIFVCGFVGSVRCSVSYTSGCEFLEKRYQIWSSTVTQMINACVPMFLAIYFWKVSDYWRYFFFGTLTICIFNCVNCFFIPESPRWLFSKKRNEEGVEIINKIARINKKSEVSFKDYQSIEDNPDNSNSFERSLSNISEDLSAPLTLIWKSQRDRNNITIIALYWFMACIMNYIMNFYIKYIPIDRIFLMILIAAVAELSSKTLNGILINKMGFRDATLFFQTVCILVSFLYVIFFDLECVSDSCYSTIELVLMGASVFVLKLAASANFASMYFACPTFFESKIAVTAYNICNISGKIGAVIAPLLAEIPGRWPMVIFLACAVLCFLLTSSIQR